MTKIKINKILTGTALGAILSLTVFSFALSALATTPTVQTHSVVKPPTSVDLTSSTIGSPSQIYNTVITYISWAYSIIIALVFLYIAIQGIKYIASGGDTEKAGDAKTGILYGLLGLALIIGVGFLIQFIAKVLGITLATSFTPF